MQLRSTGALVALALVACAGTPTQPRPRAAVSPRPRLVVAVVIDQLGWATLERYRAHLDPDGALRTIAAAGVTHRVAYQHAATYTAAGHASIFTGVSPRVHGVMSNRVFDPERGPIASCDDGSCPVFGHEERFASPAILRAPTVADALRAAVPAARIVGLSFKDRGSVIPAGQRPDAVVFWDKSTGAFTTSRFYGDALPGWVSEFMAAHPSEERMGPWTPEDPTLLARVLGPDDRVGEGGLGYGARFPHDPRDAGDEAPASAFRATPAAAEYLFDLTRAAASAHALGEDDAVDLLTLSISTTDYAGHCFGHGSWEYLDVLTRLDRSLGELLRELEAERGPIAVLITSDHGHADVAQAMEGGGRVNPEALVAGVDAAIDAAAGEGDWVLAYTEPFIYLSDAGLAAERRGGVVGAALDHLRGRPGVERAYDVAAIGDLAASTDPVEQLVYESVADGAPGQIFVVLSRGWMVDDDDVGASHGTPWRYDREVPLLFAGPGIEPLADSTPHDQRRVAATLSALLGIAPPASAPAQPLPGAPVF